MFSWCNTDGMKKTEFEGNGQNANHPFNSFISCTVYCYFPWWLKPSSCCPLLFFPNQNYIVKKDGTDGKFRKPGASETTANSCESIYLLEASIQYMAGHANTWFWLKACVCVLGTHTYTHTNAAGSGSELIMLCTVTETAFSEIERLWQKLLTYLGSTLFYSPVPHVHTMYLL